MNEVDEHLILEPKQFSHPYSDPRLYYVHIHLSHVDLKTNFPIKIQQMIKRARNNVYYIIYQDLAFPNSFSYRGSLQLQIFDQ